MAGFYTARSRPIPPLPWQTFAPPFSEYRSFRRLVQILREEVQDVTMCDPYVALPDLSAHNLVLLDYYLNGPSQGGDLAVTAATTIHNQRLIPFVPAERHVETTELLVLA